MVYQWSSRKPTGTPESCFSVEFGLHYCPSSFLWTNSIISCWLGLWWVSPLAWLVIGHSGSQMREFNRWLMGRESVWRKWLLSSRERALFFILCYNWRQRIVNPLGYGRNIGLRLCGPGIGIWRCAQRRIDRYLTLTMNPWTTNFQWFV